MRLLHQNFLSLFFFASVLSILPTQTKAQVVEVPLDNSQIVSVTFGYINKDWVTETEEGTFHENFWGEPDKRLHGWQLGIAVQPTLRCGLGLKSGLFFEGCISRSEFVQERDWDNFKESSLYLPLHVVWQIPIGPDCYITPFAGLGFNWAIDGEFQEDCRYYYDSDGNYYGPHQHQQYGWGDAPKRWNNQFEFGADLSIKNLRLGFTYSKGFRNHEVYEGYKTYQNKLAFNIGFCVDLNE